MGRMVRARGVLVVALAALMIAHVGCGGGGPARHESPQASFDAAKAALKAKDYEGFCNCLTPESHDMMAGGMIVMATMMKALGGLAALGGEEARQEFEAKLKAITEVLDRHGVKEDQLKSMMGMSGSAPPEDRSAVFAKLTAPIKDKPAFIGDIMKALESLEGEKPGGMGPGKPTDMFDGKLEGLKIEGDTASAKVVVTHQGQTKRDPIGFRKVNGGWLIEIKPPEGE